MSRFSLLLLAAGAGIFAATIAAAGSGAYRHRYLVERTFPPGALEGLDATTKAKGKRQQRVGWSALGQLLCQR